MLGYLPQIKTLNIPCGGQKVISKAITVSLQLTGALLYASHSLSLWFTGGFQGFFSLILLNKFYRNNFSKIALWFYTNMTSLYPFSKNFINIPWTNVWKTYMFLDYFWVALLSDWFDYRSKDAIQHIMMYELWAYKVVAWLSKDMSKFYERPLQSSCLGRIRTSS